MVTAVGVLITSAGDQIPLRNDSVTNGTETSLLTDSNVTTAAVAIGDYKPGAVITHGVVSAGNSMSYAYVLRQGVIVSICNVGLAGVADELKPLSLPVTLQPGDDLRILSLSTTARNAALCVTTNAGISRIFVATPNAAGTFELLDLQTSNSIGSTLQGQSVISAYFTSVDGTKIVSGTGAWIKNPSGQVVGAFPSTSVAKNATGLTMQTVPIALNFVAEIVTNA